MDYIKKLNFAARWFLPQNEAEDVVNDYQEMLAEGGEDPEERFGSPVKAVLELTDSATRPMAYLPSRAFYSPGGTLRAGRRTAHCPAGPVPVPPTG